MKKYLSGFLVFVMVFSMFSFTPNQASAITVTPSTTVTVTGNTAAGENQPGWMFNRDISTSTPFAFNTSASSIGTGSLNILPIGANASDKMIAENFINTPISQINSIAYDFKIGAGGVDTQEEQFYMNVYANFGVSDDLKYYDCRYSVVPTTGSTAGFTTVTFDPTLSYPVATRTGGSASPFTCPSVPADMDTLSAGSNIRMFALNVGDTSASDVGLDGFFDKVVVSTDSLITTYDFEPVPLPLTTKVTIVKYINGVPATAENTGGASFPMVASWSADNIGTGSGSYALSSTGFNNPNPYQATTSDMTTGADYSTYENTSTTCAPESEYALVGYSTGNTLEGAQEAEVTETVPSFTDLTSDKFVIVWNKTCVPLPVHMSPADNTVTTTVLQTLIDWSDVLNWALPISYIYQASNTTDTNPDGSFLSPVYTSVPLAMSEIPTPGTPEGMYFWHVKAMDDGMNSSAWTMPWKITIDNTPEPMCSEDATTTVVSDTSVQVDEHDALAIEPHPAYTSIMDAIWIWSDAFTLDGDEELSAAIGSKTFTKDFTVTGTPLDSTLEIASDNTYTVLVNGSSLDTGTSGTDENNFSSADTWTIPSSMLMSGSNTISFTVDNQGKPEGYTGPNPAGLLFKLSVHQNECVTPEEPDPEPTYVKVHLYKYLVNGESTTQVADNSEITPFPMTATWDASNIGSGTGNYILGNQHGGAAFVYAADTSAMLAPVASYTSFERTGVSEDGVANVVPVGGQCVANQYRLVGYKSGTTLEAAQGAGISTTAPIFTNFSTDEYVIVVNEDCDDVLAQEENNNEEENNEETPATGTLIVRKTVINDNEGTKDVNDFPGFQVNGGEVIPFNSNEESENPMTAQNTIVLEVGRYTVTESEPEGYYRILEDNCRNIDITAGNTFYCDITNNDNHPGTGGGNSGGQVLGSSTENTGGSAPESKPEGEVLGATAESCAAYMNGFVFWKRKNDPEQVKLLQAFLNEHMGTTLKVDGVFGKTTRDAVKAFQEKYKDETLTPWERFGLKDGKGTGNVYKTTLRQINMIKCSSLNLPMPQLP